MKTSSLADVGDELTEAEEEFRALLTAPKAYSSWAREVREQWAARREADAVRAVALAQAEAQHVEEKRAKRKGKAP